MSIEWREVHWPRPLNAGHVSGFLQALAADTRRGALIWEVRSSAGRSRYLLGAEPGDLTAVLRTMDRLLPETTASEVTATDRVDVERAGQVRIRQHNLNLALDGQAEALRAILAALSHTHGTDEVLVLQVVMGRALAPEIFSDRAPDPTASLSSRLLAGARPAAPNVRARLRDKLSQYRFRVVVRVGVTAPSSAQHKLLVHALLTALRTMQSGGTRIGFVSTNPEQVNDAVIPLRQPLRLTAGEVLPFLAWPLGADALPGLAPLHPRRIAPPATFRASGERRFATTTAPGVNRPIGIPIDEALRHTHIYGPTGAGKSTLLLHLISADIAAGRSVVVIDPKRDLGTDVLARIPEHRTGDVVLIDPMLKRSAGINPFAGLADSGADDAQRALVAEGMLDLFRGLFPGAFGPLTADTLHAALLTLTYAPDATLAQLPALFTEPAYLRKVLTGISDPTLRGFWAGYDSKSAAVQAAAVAPVMTRLRQFLLRPGVRAVLDQPKPRFQIGDLFTSGQSPILIVSLNRGLLGTQTASLLGSLVVSKLWQHILRRARVPQGKRTPVSIYIDEAQHFLHLGDLAEALEQSRSLGAAWHLAHQHRAQMPDRVMRAIDANARNKIIFGLEDDEAKVAARTTGLDAEDFARLPPHEVYLSLLSGGQRTGWFSGRVLPPPKATSSPDAVTAEAEARYGGKPAQPAAGGADPGASQTSMTDEVRAVGVDAEVDEPIGRAKRNPQP